MNPEERIWQLSQGLAHTQALHVVAELGVADELADAPLPLDELARRTGAHAGALHRFLRALASDGVFVEQEPRLWANTETSGLLRRGNSWHESAYFFGTAFYRAFGDALHAARTGEAAFPRVFGADWWTWLDEHPDESARFDRMMSGGDPKNIEAFAALDWRGNETVVDVGGGVGTLLIGLLQRHPGLRGIVFERRAVAEEAERRIAAAGLEHRCTAVAGNFFDAVPAADVYILRAILHDWDDERAAAILRNLAATRVLIMDSVVPAGNEPDEIKWFDLLMLVLIRGKERTEEEWRALLAAGGFRLERVHDGSILEALPA